MNKILNMPKLDDNYEYCFGPVPEGWRGKFVEAYNGIWYKTNSLNNTCALCRREKEKIEENIELLIKWEAIPVIRTNNEEDFECECFCILGLGHWVNGNEYRLKEFKFEDGTCSKFICNNDSVFVRAKWGVFKRVY